MKKTVKIEMYFDVVGEFGLRHWNYVCSVWGDHIELERGRWYLRAVDDSLISVGNISELHGNGRDDFDYKFVNVVRY